MDLDKVLQELSLPSASEINIEPGADNQLVVNRSEDGRLHIENLARPQQCEEIFFQEMERYMEEKGGRCFKSTLAPGGLKLYVTEVSEKILRKVVLPHVEQEAAKQEWTVKHDEGPLVVDKHGTVKWSEIVIA